MMDRRLKERLIGATLLVAVIVLVVPELLSGPKHPSVPPLAEGLSNDSTQHVIVDLSNDKATADANAGAAAQTPPTQNPGISAPSSGANGSASNSAAIGSNELEPPPASAPSVTTLRAQNGTPPPLETPASPPKITPSPSRPTPEAAAPSQHAWSVQLGSFASKANADKLVHRLQESGGSFYVSPGGSGSAERFRVRMGPLSDRAAAEHALAKLKSQGHAGTIVAPGS